MDAVDIDPIDMMSRLHELSEATIRWSNRHYATWSSAGTVENLSWSADRILATCEDTLLDKVRKGLVGVSPMESRGLLVLFKMMNIIMDIDDSALHSLTENLQVLRLKDVPGYKVETTVSYLKGALMLLSNCGKLPNDIIGLLKDIFCSVECNEFTAFMLSVYFEHELHTHTIDYAKYLSLAESEYRTQYRKQKWLAAKTNPSSAFFVGDAEDNDEGDATEGRGYN